MLCVGNCISLAKRAAMYSLLFILSGPTTWRRNFVFASMKSCYIPTMHYFVRIKIVRTEVLLWISSGVSDVCRNGTVVWRAVGSADGRLSPRDDGTCPRRASTQTGVGAKQWVIGRRWSAARLWGPPHVPSPRRGRSTAVQTGAQPCRQQPRVSPQRIRLPGTRYQVG